MDTRGALAKKRIAQRLVGAVAAVADHSLMVIMTLQPALPAVVSHGTRRFVARAILGARGFVSVLVAAVAAQSCRSRSGVASSMP